MGSSPSKKKDEVKTRESPPPFKGNENFYKNRDQNVDSSKFQYIHYNDYPKGEQVKNYPALPPTPKIPPTYEQYSPPPLYSNEKPNIYSSPEYPPPNYRNNNQYNASPNELRERFQPQSSRSYYPTVIKHAPIIRREPYYN